MSLRQLQLLQMADSALPIGATAHSFGLETLTAEGLLTVDQLEVFLRDYLIEVGSVEAVFCRAAHRLVNVSHQSFSKETWMDINNHLSAFKPARESRIASATLGRRFMQLLAGLCESSLLHDALQAAKQNEIEIHHSTAFGFVGGAFEFDEETTVLALGHQTLAGLVSAFQRLLPLGQNQASKILWNLKPTLAEVCKQSQKTNISALSSFAPLVDLGSMRHPTLMMRLFIS